MATISTESKALASAVVDRPGCRLDAAAGDGSRPCTGPESTPTVADDPDPEITGNDGRRTARLLGVIGFHCEHALYVKTANMGFGMPTIFTAYL